MNAKTRLVKIIEALDRELHLDAAPIKVETDDDGHDVISVYDDNIGITLSLEPPPHHELYKELGIHIEPFKVTQYEVWWCKHYPATRWDPEDVDIITEKVTMNLHEVVKVFVDLCLGPRIGAAMETAFYLEDEK